MIFRISLFLFTCCFSSYVLALEFVSYNQYQQSLVINTDEQQLIVTPLSNNSVQVHYQTDRNFPSYALDENRLLPTIKTTITNSEHVLTYRLPNMVVILNKPTLTLSFLQHGQLLTRHKIQIQSTKHLNLSFDISNDEFIMGAGERVLGMNRRGHRLPLYNRAHYGYTTFSEQMNYSLPAIMSDKKYIVLFDNSAKGWIDIGKTKHDTLHFESVGGRAAFIVIAGFNYPTLIQNFVDLTGKQPLPARWVLGNHASRFGYKTQQQVLDTINRYQELAIPVDSVILDLYWFGKDVKGHMGNLSWDENAFPTPDKMIADLNSLGVKTTLISEPFVLTNSKRYEEAKQHNALSKDMSGNKVKHYDFFFGHTALIDVFSHQGQQWFGSVYEALASQGVEGVWGDLGEPEVHPSDMLHDLSNSGIMATADEVHNVYGHQWAQLVYQTLTKQYPTKRPFILMRSGFAGSQRYGLIPWTGDVSRSWGGLKPQVELSLQMSLFGLAYTHSDLGGFAGDTYDKEMYIRWLQYGVFQPVYRPHAQDKVPSEPVFHDKQTQDIIRKFIELRYQLLPYNYTLAYENSMTGMPLMRPMFFGSNDKSMLAIKDQFLWGDSFLIKPVTEPNISQVSVYAPKGNWFNYWTGEKLTGGQNIDIAVDINTLPILIKAGSIIPSVAAVMSTELYNSEQLKLDFYFDEQLPNSQATMFEDDGKSANSVKNKQFELLNFNANFDLNNQTLVFALNREIQGAYKGMPLNREVELTVHNWNKKAEQITLNKLVLTQETTKEQWHKRQNIWHVNQEQKQLKVKFVWHPDKAKLLIK